MGFEQGLGINRLSAAVVPSHDTGREHRSGVGPNIEGKTRGRRNCGNRDGPFGGGQFAGSEVLVYRDKTQGWEVYLQDLVSPL